MIAITQVSSSQTNIFLTNTIAAFIDARAPEDGKEDLSEQLGDLYKTSFAKCLTTLLMCFSSQWQTEVQRELCDAGKHQSEGRCREAMNFSAK
jgi:hypothetical protein